MSDLQLCLYLYLSIVAQAPVTLLDEIWSPWAVLPTCRLILRAVSKRPIKMPLCCSRRSRREDYDSESDDDLDEKPAIERKSRRSSGGIEKSSESRYDKNARLIELQPNGRLDWLRFVFRGTCKLRLRNRSIHLNIVSLVPIWLRIVFVLCDLAGVAALGYSLDQDYWKIKKVTFASSVGNLPHDYPIVDRVPTKGHEA